MNCRLQSCAYFPLKSQSKLFFTYSSIDSHLFDSYIGRHSLSSDNCLRNNEVDIETANIERQELIAFDETYRRIFKDMIPDSNEIELMEAFRWIEKVGLRTQLFPNFNYFH